MTHIIALAQCSANANIQENLKTAKSYIAKAGKEKAKLIIFPEYFMLPCTIEQNLYISQAQTLDGPFVSHMRKLASAGGMWVIFGMNETSSSVKNKSYNTLVVLDNRGKIRGSYRKTHLFDAFDWKESSHTIPGDSFFEPLDTPFGKLGLGTCYDLRFPELARYAALKGAQIMVYPSAWVRGSLKDVQWKSLLMARAIENGMFAIGCSHCTPETYMGRSIICSPEGAVLAEAGEKETLLLCSIDPEESDRIRSLIPSLKNRRRDLYQSVFEKYFP